MEESLYDYDVRFPFPHFLISINLVSSLLVYLYLAQVFTLFLFLCPASVLHTHFLFPIMFLYRVCEQRQRRFTVEQQFPVIPISYLCGLGKPTVVFATRPNDQLFESRY